MVLNQGLYNTEVEQSRTFDQKAFNSFIAAVIEVLVVVWCSGLNAFSVIFTTFVHNIVLEKVYEYKKKIEL